MSIDVQEAWKHIWNEEVAEIKKQFPHIPNEGAKLLALETATPRFVMVAISMNQQETKETKETKNVKRRKKEQGDDKQASFDLDGAS